MKSAAATIDMEHPTGARWGDSPHEPLSSGVLSGHALDSDIENIPATRIALLGVQFRTPRPLLPGTIRHLRIGDRNPRLTSDVRVISCRPRVDGLFDIRAEIL